MLPQEVLLTTGAARRDAGGIYMIYCAADAKCYIGQSVNINSRIGHHKRELRSNKHHNSYLQAAWNKHGEEAFSFAALENCPKDQLNDRELAWVTRIDLDRLFNLGSVGDSFPRTAENRRRISEGLKGRTRSAEHCRNISDAKKGKPVSPEALAKLREGIARYNASGKRKTVFTAEAKAKMSASRKGRKLTPEHRAKLSAAKVGKKLSPEHCRHISEGNKGKSVSEESRRKMSEAHKGKPITPERLAKLQEGARRFISSGKKAATYTPQVRANMSAAKKGKPNPAGTANLLKYAKGPRTPEHKAKLAAILAEANKRRKETNRCKSSA